MTTPTTLPTRPATVASPPSPLPEAPEPPSSNIHTYHCLCTHLLLATTTPLGILPRRKAGLDSAYILPLPLPPRSREADSGSDSEDEEGAETAATKKSNSDPGGAEPAETPGDSKNAAPPETSDEIKSVEKTHYALLLSTQLDRQATTITRSDGFEKRYIQRCPRCRTPFGYQLDWAQYSDSDSGGDGEKGKSVATPSTPVSGRRTDVIYLLPGGLVTTKEMREGKVGDGKGGWEEE